MKEYVEDAFKTASAFLRKSRQSEYELWGHLDSARGEPYLFWWSDDIPLVEIPLVDVRDGSVSGYLLVSADRRLPPIMEYARTGPPLSHQTSYLVRTALHTSGIRRGIDKIYFISSTEIVVRLTSQPKDAETHYLTVPELRPFAVAKGIAVKRNPRSTFSPVILKQLWDVRTPNNPGDQPEVILTNFKPVRYQQNCDHYDKVTCQLTLGSGNTYCSPHCIAGCVPVAWAMLLSAWKRSKIWGADAIWRNSKCWSIEWPSVGGTWNASQCADVEKSIWRLHALMNTTCDGSTSDGSTMAGAGIFAEMGLNWRWGSWQNASFDKARTITSAGQAYLFTGQGQWERLMARKKASGSGGKAGHGVVVYGYKKADRTVRICLGWGYSFADKSINYDQYSQTRCAFVVGTKATSRADVPLELP